MNLKHCVENNANADNGPDIQEGPSSSGTLRNEEQQSHTYDDQPVKKMKKVNKRKKTVETKQGNKHFKGKSVIDTCDADEDKQQDGRTKILSRNADSEEGEDSTHFHTMSAICEETSLGSSILDEVLSEKKRALLESDEIVEFLRGRLKS